jgi:phage terminase large subunit-like protein
VLEAADRIHAVINVWKPAVVLVEESSWGLAILELVRQVCDCALGRRPTGSKIDRLTRHLGRLEANNIELPSASLWLAEFERELLGFPNSKNDDQVDALTQALDHLRGQEPSIAWDLPVVLR